MADVLDRINDRILTPEQDGYDEVRSVWNAMINRRPVIIY